MKTRRGAPTAVRAHVDRGNLPDLLPQLRHPRASHCLREVIGATDLPCLARTTGLVNLPRPVMQANGNACPGKGFQSSRGFHTSLIQNRDFGD